MKATPILTVLFSLGVIASTVFAEGEPKSTEANTDRMRYQQLTRELKTVDGEYHAAMKQAVLETQKKGQASLETKSRLLSLDNKRDRLLNRITLVALRHGWRIPGKQNAQEVSEERADEKHRVFEPADRLIQQRFKRDAQRIIARVTLPLISLQTVH